MMMRKEPVMFKKRKPNQSTNKTWTKGLVRRQYRKQKISSLRITTKHGNTMNVLKLLSNESD